MKETILIKGVAYRAFCEGKPEHRQGVAKLVKLVRVSDGTVVWPK